MAKQNRKLQEIRYNIIDGKADIWHHRPDMHLTLHKIVKVTHSSLFRICRLMSCLPLYDNGVSVLPFPDGFSVVVDRTRSDTFKLEAAA